MATKKPKQVKDAIDPEVIVGSHLTVYKYANGQTILEWDDAALTRDVQAALDSVAEPKAKKATTAKAKTTTTKTKKSK